MTTKFKILSAISFIALAVVLTFVGVWALTDLDFTVGGNIEYTAPAPEPVTPDEVSYLTFEYDTTNYTAKLTACSSSAPETVEIPSRIEYNNQTYTVTSIAEGYWDEMEYEGEGIFYGTNVKNLYIPDSITEIGNYAFLGCSFTSLSIGKSIQQDFGGSSYIFKTTSVQNVIIRNGVTRIGTSFFKGAYVNNIELPNTLKEIGESSFLGVYYLTNITIPESVTSIGEFAFSECWNLSSITIPDSVTSIGGCAFQTCIGLTGVELGRGVTSIGDNTFSGCSELTSITIPNKVASIGDRAFYYCTGLTSITIPASVTSITGNPFLSCSGLETIIVESGNTKYNSNNNCNAIIETSTNTLITGCKNTVIPSTVTSIGDHAFQDCAGLTSIIIPDSVTSIGSSAFYGCTGLTSVTIGSGVTSIDSYAFSDCTSLVKVEVKATAVPTGWYGMFYNCPLTTGILVPSASVDLYKSAGHWKDYNIVDGGF